MLESGAKVLCGFGAPGHTGCVEEANWTLETTRTVGRYSSVDGGWSADHGDYGKVVQDWQAVEEIHGFLGQGGPLPHKRLKQIRGFLIYVARSYL